MTDDDRLRMEVPVRALHRVEPGGEAGVLQGAVPHGRDGAPEIGGDPVDGGIVVPERRPEVRCAGYPEHIGQKQLTA